MRHLFDRPLGACAPNGSLFKCNAAAAAIGGDLASALIGGWFSARNTENAAVLQHNSNRILQKWQQQYTQQNMHDQYKYDMMAWNENNQYNSPRAQMERLRSAGLNPYLVMNGASAGSMPQTPAPNTHVGPQGASASSPAVQPAQMPRLNAAELIMQGSQIKNQQIEAFAKLADSAPSLVKSIGPDAAKSILSSAYGQSVDMKNINQFVDNEMNIQGAMKTQEIVKANIAKEYGMKSAENALAIQQQEYSKIVGQLNLMHTEAEKNRADIHKLAAQYCEAVANAYRLRKQGDVYSVQAYILDNIKEYNISLQRLALNRAQRQDYTESAFFEANRDLYNYLRNDSDAKEIQLENFKNNNDTFWNEVNVIMSSWQVKTNVGVSGSYGRKDTYGHGFGYDD